MLNTIGDFSAYCLRKLGDPVIQINLAPSQIEDAVEDAILKFVEYHRDGFEEHYFIHTFTSQAEADLREFDIPADLGIDDVIEIIPVNGSTIQNGRFDTYAWQAGAAITSPISGGWANTSLQDYSVMMQRFADLSAVLGEVFCFRFSKYKRKCRLMFRVSEGESIALKTYRRIDPRVVGNEDAWNDPWLKAYATALIKERWGNVLIKAAGVRLVGGVELNGQLILDSAKEEIRDLEEQLKRGHQEPINFMVG